MEAFSLKTLESRRRHIFCGHIALGASFMLLAFFTAKFFAPDIDSNAATQTAEQTHGPQTMSMSNDSVVTINATPSDTQAIYTATNNLKVLNTCDAGARITIKTSGTSNALTRLAVSNDQLTKTINATTGTSLVNNSWGISNNSGSTWKAVPASNSTTITTVYDESRSRTSAYTVPVTFGIKVDNTIPSGAYTNDVIYTMTPNAGCLVYAVTWDANGGSLKANGAYPDSLNWNSTIDLTNTAPTRTGYVFAGWSNGTTTFTADQADVNINPSNALNITMTAQWSKTIHTISNMQDMTPEVCNATTKPAKTATAFDWDGSHHDDTSYVPRTALKDTRDETFYLVSKLADGNCWMSQNLALDLTKNTAIIASNNDGTTVSVIPDNTTQTTGNVTWMLKDDSWHSYHPTSDESYYRKGATKNKSPSGSGDSYLWESAGNYYNWYAATAGTGTSTLANAEATASICPKGWRLPSNTGRKSFQNLIVTSYGLANNSTGSVALRGDPLNFVLAGRYNGNMSYQGSAGVYWTSLAAGATYSFYLRFDSSTVRPQQTNAQNSGYNIRCVNI